MDDGFRKQLETKEISYEERVKELSHQYELTIAEHQHKVGSNMTISYVVQLKVCDLGSEQPLSSPACCCF